MTSSVSGPKAVQMLHYRSSIYLVYPARCSSCAIPAGSSRDNQILLPQVLCVLVYALCVYWVSCGGWMWVSVRSLDCDNDNDLVLLSSWPKTLPVSHVSLLCSQQLKLISSGEQFSQKQSVESQLGKLETSLSSHSPTQQHPLPPPFSGWTTTIVC